MKTEAKGVGGWLLLLVAGLLVFGPIRAIVSTYDGFAEAERLYPVLIGDQKWRTFVTLGWTAIAVTIALSVYTAIRLIRGRSPADVSFAKMALWLIGPISAIVIRFGIQPAIFGWSISPSEVGEITALLVGAFVWAGIWTLYLSKSVRVRNTYNLPTYPTETAPSKFRISSLWTVSNVNNEGVRRLCVAVNVIGIAWATLLLVAAANSLSKGYEQDAVLFGGVAIAGFALARVLTWVVSGFASRPSTS